MARKQQFTTIAVSPETRERMRLLQEALKVDADDLVNMLIDYFERQNTLENAPSQSPQPVAVAKPQPELVDLIWVLEPAVEAFLAILSVYPDLRAEAGMSVLEFQRRWLDVAVEAGIIKPQSEEGSGVETATEQDSEGEFAES